MMKSRPGPRFLRELTQGSLTGNLCGLFNDKNHRKTGGVMNERGKKQISSGGGSGPPKEERVKTERERLAGEMTY